MNTDLTATERWIKNKLYPDTTKIRETRITEVGDKRVYYINRKMVMWTIGGVTHFPCALPSKDTKELFNHAQEVGR